MPEFGPQSVWNMAWAVATTLCRDERLLDGLGQVAVEWSHELTPQGLSNMVRGFATLARREVPLLHAAAGQALRKLPEFDAQVGSRVMWISLEGLGQHLLGLRCRLVPGPAPAGSLRTAALHRAASPGVCQPAVILRRLGLSRVAPRSVPVRVGRGSETTRSRWPSSSGPSSPASSWRTRRGLWPSSECLTVGA